MKEVKKSGNRELEKSHLRHFAKMLPNFPVGRQDWESEKPDLLVHTEKGDLGIEHTQLFRVKGAPNVVLPQAQEKYRRKVMSIAKSSFEESFGGMFQVYAYFSRHDKDALTEAATKEAASRLTNVMVHAVQLSGQEVEDGNWRDIEKWSYDKSFPDRFPPQIDSIKFRAVSRAVDVLWGVPDGGIVPKITAEYIQQEIDGKDQKVTNYLTRCSAVWLLMVADNGVFSSYFNMSQEVAELTYQSRFNRVFYFEHFDGKIVELKIISK